MRITLPCHMAVTLAMVTSAFAQSQAVIAVRPERELGRVDPMLYGQFIEHLGACIDGGLFAPGSALSDTNGFRRDVLEKARELSADSMTAANSLASPADECVRSRRLTGLPAANGHEFPARSISILAFRPAETTPGAKP